MSLVNDDAFRMETNADSDSDSNVSSESEGGMLIDEEIMNVTAKAKSVAPASKETTPTKHEPVDSDSDDLDEEPKKRGKKRKRGEKSKVKRPRTAYMYFMQQMRGKVQQENAGMKFTEVTKEVGRLWNALSAEEKKPYEEKAEGDTKRWEEDKKNAALNPKTDLESLSDDSDLDSDDGKGKKVRRPRKKRKTDPNAPKRALTPYIIFLTERREQVITELREKDPNFPIQQVLKLIGEQWRALPADEKQKYVERAEVDKERFKKEKEEYSKKSEGTASNTATPTKPEHKPEATAEVTPVKPEAAPTPVVTSGSALVDKNHAAETHNNGTESVDA